MIPQTLGMLLYDRRGLSVRVVLVAAAVSLWWRYQINGGGEALRLLLEYNKEDVVNLIALKRKLGTLHGGPKTDRPSA
jgi:uncharacterized protein YprB with RNaseH-like and TPR domain